MKISKAASVVASLLLSGGVNVLAGNGNGKGNDKRKRKTMKHVRSTLQDARNLALLELDELFDREENEWTRRLSMSMQLNPNTTDPFFD